MDIAAVSLGMSQAKVNQEAKISMMKMVMDLAKRGAAEIAKMMEVNTEIIGTVMPHLGGNIDVRA